MSFLLGLGYFCFIVDGAVSQLYRVPTNVRATCWYLSVVIQILDPRGGTVDSVHGSRTRPSAWLGHSLGFRGLDSVAL